MTADSPCVFRSLEAGVFFPEREIGDIPAG
jgi:hypothetical protein